MDLATSQHTKNTKDRALLVQTSLPARLGIVKDARSYNESLRRIAAFKLNEQRDLLKKINSKKAKHHSENAVFTNINASHSNLTGSDFRDIDCSHSVFTGCDLTGTLWENAILAHSDFRGVKYIPFHELAKAKERKKILLDQPDRVKLVTAIKASRQQSPTP